ncbi:Protein Y51F10.3 [Aphelenchoides avenae]|nr:Protein Y51F10.3 [Aphelenchus avenae]
MNLSPTVQIIETYKRKKEEAKSKLAGKVPHNASDINATGAVVADVQRPAVGAGKPFAEGMPVTTLPSVKVQPAAGDVTQLHDVPKMTTLPNPPLPPPVVENKAGDRDIVDVVSSVWEKMKKIIGFSPPCENDGHKNLRGECECHKYFEGERCERIICINNGTRVRHKTKPFEEVCRCPHPDFITGKHCQVVNCQNGGRDLGNGHCKCIDTWYTGQFCQYYASSWFAVLGVPLLCLAIIIICCVVCRLDLCPRRSSSQASRERRHRRRRQSHNTTYPVSRHAHAYNGGRYVSGALAPDPRATEQALMIQENLLNEAVICDDPPFPSQHNMVRLENVPAYNPRLLNELEFKPVDPPPSYDQACHSIHAVARCMAVPRNVRPPNYSPPRHGSQSSIGAPAPAYSQPPPPSFPPPEPPRDER